MVSYICKTIIEGGIEGLVVADVDEYCLLRAAARGHLVVAAQHGGVPADTGVGVDRPLHGGQVLNSLDRKSVV